MTNFEGDRIMKALEGKVAVITGGSSGIGLATAKLFQQAGAKVAISGRSQQSLDQAAQKLGPGTVAVRSDVSKLGDLDQLFAVVSEKLGRIDVLFANAGIAKFAAVSDVSEGAYDETFDINVKGVFFTVQKAIPFLNDNASVILNTSFVNQAGVPTTSVYAASKAAVRSLARSISSELAGRGIRVNVVSPGPISTPIYSKLGLPKEAVDAFAANIVSQVPLKRFGKPEEVAQTALFLASSASSYITGVELNVDGGLGQV
jgi:NAD(P)-dependent dehydrogenase (short-subunit alcohol dehydrogenase family)